MIFSANISSAEKHSVWRRVIHNLGSLHEEIRITITQRELIIWSMNNTDTSMSQARFKRSFFEDYEFNPELTVFGEDGLQQVKDRAQKVHKLYSFKINGKHLAVLFRKPENDNIKVLNLAIHNGATCPESLANRLQITIYTENLMVKEYSPNIVPIKYDPIVINLRYKKRFLEVYGNSCETQEEQLDPRLLKIFESFDKELAESYFNSDILSVSKQDRVLTPEDEINYLCCNHQLLKNFIDSCNTNTTEEVKLEVSVTKLCLTAFTKGIYSKNNDVLRNAMRATNIVGTNDLEHYCLFTTTGDEDKKRPLTKVISFGMKDFKNFVNMATIWKGDQNVNIWFCRSGDPFFLELDKSDLRLELVQVTDSGEVMIPTGNKFSVTRNSPLKDGVSVKLVSPRKSPLKNTSPSVLSASKDGGNPMKPKSLFINDDSTQEQQRWKNPIRGKRLADAPLENDLNTSFEFQEENQSKAQRTRTTIEWGKLPSETTSHSPTPTFDQRDVLKQEKKRFLQNLKLQREREQQSPSRGEDDQLGPTQKDKPKGLFD
ncbi:LANO_0E04500g1_1 [Lachancea nothofagi CBS 11611]|uniref:LANO_0E04500g1_1 n=1 Tax=Lachancea nothofagi CBS 11611 TaxID=1266666 RepID=A0A1G4JS37_9SACH|nr:LANO_0E04500g1_1 [Lachancea nothofagi CBS 11611]